MTKLAMKPQTAYGKRRKANDTRVAVPLTTFSS
jgi:hypothetical protein